MQGFLKQKLKGENRDEKKRKLLDLLKGKGKPKEKRLKIKLVLDLELHVATRVKKHADARYIWDGYISILHRKGVSVHLLKGGDTRTLSVKVNSNVQDLVKIGKSVFFPDGESFFGNIAEM